MLEMNFLSIAALPSSLENELERVFLTFVLALGMVGINFLIQRQIKKRADSLPQRRLWAAWTRNICWTIGAALVFSLWASRLAGFALSVAALAAAILVVSKELVGCLLGTFYMTLSRPFAIGDFIEVGDLRGQVVSANPFSVMLVQNGDANQITGKMAAVPSSVFLVTPVKNLSATGRFSMFLVRVHVPRLEDVLAHSRHLLDAAKAECAPWQDAANREFEDIELSEHVDLPSAAPKVLYELGDPKQPALVLRFTCEPNLRVRTEQAILRRYLEQVYGAPEKPAAIAQAAAEPAARCRDLVS